MEQHVCEETNHSYQPRYTTSLPDASLAEKVLDEWNDSSDIVDILDALKAETYLGDVCIHCGSVVMGQR